MDSCVTPEMAVQKASPCSRNIGTFHACETWGCEVTCARQRSDTRRQVRRTNQASDYRLDFLASVSHQRTLSGIFIVMKLSLEHL